MAQPAEKKKDQATKRVQALAEGWLKNHGFERARVEVYRRMPGRSIRVRVVDRQFSGKLLEDRARMTEGFLVGLPEEIDQEITLVLLLSPDELKKNLMNVEFDHPSPVVL
jgi:ribosome maturation factor RimP